MRRLPEGLIKTMSTMTQNRTAIQALGQGLSVLGETPVRIDVGGRIRAGVKVLTPAAAKVPQAASLFNDGVAAGKPWDVIERAIVEQCSNALPKGTGGKPKSPLMPANAPYFTVRRCDFRAPEVADRLLDLYGEDRGEGRHIYRLPIILPLDNWQANMPHGLRCYTRNELVYWSEYGPDGTRYCKTHGTVELDRRNRRAKRTFGGRPVVLRAENSGICSPEDCPEYQSRKCTLSGSLHFFVPGIPGTSAIAVPTTSFYAMQQWRQQQEMVAFLRGGRIAGLVDGQPLFWLTKQRREIPMIDDTGRPKRVAQWIVCIEANVPMDRVYAEAEHRQQVTAGAEAAAALGYQDNADDADLVTTNTADETNELTAEEREVVRSARSELFELLDRLGIDAGRFATYAIERWGPYWGRASDTLRLAIDEVTAAASNDVKAYADAVNNPVPF